MSNELLIGIGGLVLSVLTYFAGVWRTEARHKKEDSGERVNRILSAYLEFETRSKTSGLDGLLKAGAATLETDAEIREVGNLIRGHGKMNPLTLESGILEKVDLKKFFDYAAKERVNFFNVKVSDVIEKSKA